MRFYTTLLVGALVADVAASPVGTIYRGQPNILALLQNIPCPPAVNDNATLFTAPATDTHGIPPPLNDVERRLAKWATLVVDIWIDVSQQGRHEGLATDTQRCYNLMNDWNDQVSTLFVLGDFGRILYADTNCNNDDSRLTVPNGNYIANLETHGFNNIISSYLYNN
ncbi:hypothetical protein GGR58DRAFT_501171 [Xylaria digitata]|nr:hypothetical protein GGR58DRAFT_501171 [Xylaria digitata]